MPSNEIHINKCGRDSWFHQYSRCLLILPLLPCDEGFPSLVVQSLSDVPLFRPHELQHTKLLCPSFEVQGFPVLYSISTIQIKAILFNLGEGNGNPLQYSCLENPRDRGAQWAAVYGVAQSRTRLKRLSNILFSH